MNLWNFTDSSCKPFPGCGRPRKADSGDQHLFQTGMLAALLASLCPGTGPSLNWRVKTCTHFPLHSFSFTSNFIVPGDGAEECDSRVKVDRQTGSQVSRHGGNAHLTTRSPCPNTVTAPPNWNKMAFQSWSCTHWPSFQTLTSFKSSSSEICKHTQCSW